MLSNVTRRNWFRSCLLATTPLAGFVSKLGAANQKTSAGSTGKPLVLDYDVVVCGGGAGGVCAAVAAARLGQRVLLIERYGFLGGMATAGLVQNFMSFRTGGRQIIMGVFNEILQQLISRGGYNENVEDHRDCAFDAEILKLIEQELCLDSGVDLLYHALVRDVECKGDTVQRIHLATKGGDIAVNGKTFVDSTGDGDLASLSGADYMLGRESDGLTMPGTMIFEMCNVDENEINSYVSLGKESRLFEKTTELARQNGDFNIPRDYTLVIHKVQKDVVCFNPVFTVRPANKLQNP